MLGGVGLAFIAASTSACASPCTELADAICDRSGESAPACVEARLRAARPTQQERRACEDGLAFAHELSRSR